MVNRKTAKNNRSRIR